MDFRVEINQRKGKWNMKINNRLMMMAVIVAFSIAIVPAYAGQNYEKSGKEKPGFEIKFSGKIKTILAHQELLKLSEDQVKQINDLKILMKKELIRNKAEIEIVSIDIKSNLFGSDKIDLKMMEKLIDQKYKIKKEQAKSLVKAFSQLQDILNKEQKDILKNLKFKTNQPYSKCMKCNAVKSVGMCPKMNAPDAMSK